MFAGEPRHPAMMKLFRYLFARLRKALSFRTSGPLNRYHLAAEQLEPRILYSAVPAPAAEAPTQEAPPAPAPETSSAPVAAPAPVANEAA